MQVSTSNDVKIYNLSAGKSIPQWLNEKKRRNLERKDVDIRRRIQLIQDFEMPGISSSIALTADQQYIFAAGTYRPILKCYDVNDLSMKFDRGLDADVIKILPLSEDYSKVVLLQKDRYLEFHSRVGRYFRMRIPKFGRDFSFCREASDLFVVGDGSEIYRLNMEEGKFLTPLQTDADELNCCEFNDQHQLFVCGTTNGTVEAWDHRDAQRVGILNCDLDQFKDDAIVMDGNPSVTSLKFKDALNLGVGTSTGHILLYDIRSTRPRLIKNHNMGLPIQTLDFVQESDLVLSMDSRVLKIWKEQNGDPFAAIEPGSKLTQFVRYPNSGLLFFANDAPKMLQYFVPSLGPAPKWCYYLDSITEELEETEQPTVYDDYKFVTAPQLEEIGLERLIGSEYLRAYMHGYFIDIRLYNKAKTLTQPFAYENYKARKLREKVEEERETRLLLNKVKLPKVNKELASKLHADLNPERGGKLTTKKKQLASSLLEDTRFKNLFTNPDFEVDKESEQFQQITSRLQKHNEQHDNGRDYSEDEEIVGALDLNDANESRHESKDQDSTMNIDSEDYEDESDEVDETDRFGANPDASSDEEMEEEDEQSDEAEAEKPTKPKRPQRFKLVGVNTMRDFQSFAPSNDQIDPAMNLTGTMGERRKKLKELMAGQKVEDTPFGGKSMTFIMPNKKSKRTRK
ncbi:Nucleolar protein 10 [Aphelenchoides besseyi]|nr:Nucleolar protein 10 [Aphelenchoides besseyi]KAI6211752.1 Nucleolar protein 10 [Aphelenchoides besseyi]